MKAMTAGTSRAKITSITMTSASEAPRVWSRTKAKPITPAEMT